MATNQFVLISFDMIIFFFLYADDTTIAVCLCVYICIYLFILKLNYTYIIFYKYFEDTIIDSFIYNY